MDGGDMYDEFGNYIGPELESDESEKEEEEEADEEVSVWCASNRVSANIMRLVLLRVAGRK